MRMLFVFSLVVISSLVFSNDSVKVRTSLPGIQTGFGNYRYTDPLESAGVYGGSYMPLNFNWISYNQKYIDGINFTYSNIALKPETQNDMNLTDFKARCFNFIYGYHWAVIKQKKVPLYVGAKLNTYLAIKDLKYTVIPPINSTQSYQNFDLFTSLNISVSSKFSLRKNLLIANINGSLLSFVTNRTYELGRESENDLLFFPQFNSFNFSADYFYQITPWLYFNLGYQFYYYCYPRSQDILITKGTHNQILVGLNLKF